MKKIITVVLIMVLLAAAAVPCSAKAQGATIGEKEANELLQKALDFYDYMRCSDKYKDMTTKYSLPHYHQTQPPLEPPVLHYTTAYFYIVDEKKLPGGSYEAMCRCAETIYTEAAAPESYKYYSRSDDTVEYDFAKLFMRDEAGILYARRNEFDGESEFVHRRYRIKNFFQVEAEDIIGDSKSAIARVRVDIFGDGDFVDFVESQVVTVECSFKKTNDGWRISTSEMSQILAKDGKEWLDVEFDDNTPVIDPDIDPGIDPSPDTSDSAVGRFVLLPVLALACLVPLPLVRKKRHRA